MASVQEKAELVKFVHECGSIVAAQRRYRLEFNRAPPHRNSIRRWVKQFSESGDVKKKNVRAYLDQTFTDRWIGRGGPLTWPPRSPDLNPLDFYLWGHIKTNVYRTKPRSIDELKQRITDSIAVIPVAHLENAFREFERRIRLIIVNNGAHVEVY